jgi:acyl-CoA reductase-like NAD-dependent aldehyde dehydrogenase
MPPQDLKLFVAGEWNEGTGEDAYELKSPATGEHLANVPIPSKDDIDRATAAAQGAVDTLIDMGPYERAALCHRIADLVDEHAEELARMESIQQGKPFKAESLPEMEEAAENFRLAAEDMIRLNTEILPSRDVNKRILTLRRPVGAWASITPWNFPLLIPTEHLGPGLAAGNTWVCKPPAFTPTTMLRFAELAEDAGVPKGALSVLPGGPEVGEGLVTNDHIDAIAFVGSSFTGERIVRMAGLKRTLMEMSGNGPVIVLDDARIDKAAEGAVFGAYYCAGQVCCATERVIVSDAVHDEFVSATLKASDVVKLGDPFADDTTMGPLNNEPTAAKMDRHLADARERGANVLLGGGRASGFPTDLYYEFTVLDDVTPEMVVAREESFGPVVPIIRADDDEQALRIANDDPLGLQAAVYTSSLKRAFWFAERLQNGSVIVNDSTDYWETHHPFGGGTGTRSGWGRLGGKYSLLEMTDHRTVIVDLANVQ